MILSSYRKAVFVPILLIVSLVLGLMIFLRFSSLSIWDDAYIFVRYAHNFAVSGHLSWNPDGIPTYGLTSLAYLIPIISLHMLFPQQAAFVLICASFLCGCACFIGMIALLRRLIPDKTQFWFVLVFGAISGIVAAEDISVHFTSGMDTTFAMLMITIWLAVLYFSQKTWLIGATGALLFLVRPDLLLIVGSVCAIGLLSSDSRRIAGQITLIFLAVMALQVIFTSAYFHSALPLPFYAKRFGIYGEQFYGFYSNSAWGYFVAFLQTYPYVWILVLLAFVSSFRQWAWQDKGLLAGIVLFCIYHVLFVVPIMGFHQRFFYPILPALWLLSAKGLIHLLSFVPIRLRDSLANYPLPILILPLLLIPAFVNPLPFVTTLVQFASVNKPPASIILNFDTWSAYDARYSSNWYHLKQVEELPDEVVIATTEVGMVGAVNLRKSIIDLAGLNEPEFAFEGFSADVLFSETYRPDWLYMPFPHYEAMWQAIYEHPFFREHYDYYPADILGTDMGVAIYRDSPHYFELQKVMIQDE